MPNAVSIQRDYYSRTAASYDASHLDDPEHEFALSLMMSAIRMFGFRSVLDVGSGTGRALSALKREFPNLKVVGIEPSKELREIGHSKGLAPSELIDGDALSMNLPTNSFDLVCEFGVLHHVPKPAVAISEMMRVAKSAVFLSDSNDYGRGTRFTRFIKQASRAVGAWGLVDLILTKGKGYRITPDDGLWYSFSVLDHYDRVARECSRVYLTNTRGPGPNIYRSCSHVAVLGLLKDGSPTTRAFFERHGNSL